MTLSYNNNNAPRYYCQEYFLPIKTPGKKFKKSYWFAPHYWRKAFYFITGL